MLLCQKTQKSKKRAASCLVKFQLGSSELKVNKSREYMTKSNTLSNVREHCHRKVYTRVFYNSNFSSKNIVHPVHKVEANWKSYVAASDNTCNNQATIKHRRPVRKIQYKRPSTHKGTRKLNVCNISHEEGNKMQEVSASPLTHMESHQTMGKVSANIQGADNSVAPELHTHGGNAEALIKSGDHNVQTKLAANKYELITRCEESIVPLSVPGTPCKESLFKELGDKALCEITELDTNNSKSGLLFDINHSGDTDKWLNVNVSKRVQAILNGEKIINCALFSQWKNQSEFDFGFIPLLEFNILPNKNTNHPPQPPPPPPPPPS